MLMRPCILIVSILFGLETLAQDTISGVVLDSKTGNPLPYTHIILKNTNRGAITNADGYFSTICSKTDTLVFSFISYERKELPCQYFIKNQTCSLTPSINELETVLVYANLDYLIDVFVKSRIKHYRSESYKSKTYFTLETSSFGEPVELLECYYNADIHPSGIRGLILKNGRIGISNIGDGYFVSLSSTKIISGYDLLNVANFNFPQNPLQLSKKKLKKYYKTELVSFRNGVYRIQFIPKKDTNNFFNCVVMIDEKSDQIAKIELYKNNFERHPFIEINPNHHLDSLNYYVAYTYNNDSIHVLQKIKFKYDFSYYNNIKVRKMYSGGVFLFYDRTHIFDIPYYADKDEFISDYDKIVFQPYNELFWKYNKVLIPSKKVLRYREFFIKNGILLNYNELSKFYPIFRNKVIPWSEQRIFLYEINYTGQHNVEVLSLSPNSSIKKTIPTNFNFSAQIYLGRNTFGGITFYNAETLINLDKSFYLHSTNKNTTIFINIYFDLVEIGKKELIQILENGQWNKHQVDSIYKSALKKLDKELNQYLKLTYYGINEEDLGIYAKRVKRELQIDNTKLIIDDEFMVANDGNRMIDVYNYASKLFSSSKYNQSLEILLKAYNSGDNHPWLFYNLGLNYLVLSDIDKACWFFRKSEDLGKELDSYIIKKCEN